MFCNFILSSDANRWSEPPIEGDLYQAELIRGSRGFGFSIRGGLEFSMPLFVLRIAAGGVADVDGRLLVCVCL